MNQIYDFGEHGSPEDNVHILRHEKIIDRLGLLVPLYAELNTTAFALAEQTSPLEAEKRLISTDLLLVAVGPDNDPVGFGAYQFIPSAIGKVIYQARGLAPPARGLGFGKKFPQIAVRELQADYLIAKAQNPISIWSTISTGLFDSIHPIHSDFSSSPEMSQVLLDTIVARGKVGEVDLKTGVHRGSYAMGKLGDYSPDLTHEGVASVQNRLSTLRIDAKKGDAIYYGGKIV